MRDNHVVDVIMFGRMDSNKSLRGRSKKELLDDITFTDCRTWHGKFVRAG